MRRESDLRSEEKEGESTLRLIAAGTRRVHTHVTLLNPLLPERFRESESTNQLARSLDSGQPTYPADYLGRIAASSS
ncbi:hypothetical protein IscW_ISCW023147 [Ixodes scapularis]|uniref:Uncharacterized protein n=1 Tax=Ixodes scapularis TaxID=6945 RepID=B7QGY0_IXOSC|nr:hypothetical protein IscW_ISCW023147 [Ixodes scapularis]|eukprot:XP_002414437.1 hypothetical protein IscW_ISCW023147 [Ixodes scapularis]